MRLPRPAHGGIFVRVARFRPKDQIAAGEDLLQRLRQRGILPNVLRLPLAEEGNHRPRGVGVHLPEYLLVERLARFKALPRPLGPALVVVAEHIAGVVAEEIGGHAHRPLHRRRELHDLGREHPLFAPDLLGLYGAHLSQRSAGVDAQGEGRLDGTPARGGNSALLFQRAIILRKRLQDHPRTSPLSRAGTRSTPSSSFPRKNRGLTSSGSE